MLFIDASVIVAILADEADEADGETLLDRLEADGGPFLVSAVSRFEAVLAIGGRMSRARSAEGPMSPDDIETARQIVDEFVSEMEATEVRISGDITEKAIDAASRFGKVVGHPARLNMGDCFAYACARGHRARLAFKGDDFPHTDMGWDSNGSSLPSRRRP
ncbi:type II toxin-antitoxin system VapC family toxin [Fulvimarina endophytica]|uniref:Ribonuclease VapC n=1 Tax=Fulvimarina endophytica TaxID=2293836 RepID=A0A371WXY2_9HYPH|nr:type II toxin-antitoxin system VapC family toxin [Fulvimarina endophytica]RFC61831.1 type II toxin-antitoxin system VapC family toxin [Fulvimarina endophytica]